jgi:hypothetical protein
MFRKALHLPPMHILAFDGPAVIRALRFAIMYVRDTPM